MITLIGKKIAEEGTTFIYYGPAEGCDDCRFKSTCLGSLEKNRQYVITSVRNNPQKCKVHGGEEVVPVEVERAEISVLSESKRAFVGSTMVYKPLDCDLDCQYHDLCFPEGLFEDDKCVITNDEGKFEGECKKNYNLNKLTLKF